MRLGMTALCAFLPLLGPNGNACFGSKGVEPIEFSPSALPCVKPKYLLCSSAMRNQDRRRLGVQKREFSGEPSRTEDASHGDEVFILDDKDVPGAGARRSASEFWRPAPHRCVEMRLNWRRRHASGSLSWRQCAAGLRNRLRRLTDIGRPRVVLSLSCLNQKSTLCCSAMRTLRTAGRAAGNEDFSPASTTQRANSKAEANFLFESAVTH
jgi:hypothetical protein